MEKIYQVFVSSTYEDLQEERKEVIQALLELNCIPSGMEMFPAADEDQWSVIKRVIDQCDYYVVILAGRYGSISSTKGISYTEMEYRYALETGKPIIAFIHKNPGKIANNKTEQSEEGKRKLEEFKDLAQKKLCKYWSSPEELGGVVSRSFIKLIKEKPAIGWIRGDKVFDPKDKEEILNLKKEIDDLKAHIEKGKTSPPEGTENLASEDDLFEIHYSAPSFGIRNKKVPLNWYQIFYLVSPCLIGKGSEKEMKNSIERFFVDQFDMNPPYDLSIRDSDFQTIKIQFMALGLAQLANGTTRNDNNVYWTLTPYGEYIMSKIRAIKKSPPSPL